MDKNKFVIWSPFILLCLAFVTLYFTFHDSISGKKSAPTFVNKKAVAALEKKIQAKKYDDEKYLAPKAVTKSSELDMNVERVIFKYTNYIEYCIRKNWQNVEKDLDQDVAFYFNLGRDGKIISYDVLRASKSKDYQDKAIKTIIDSSPFAPFPSKIKDDIIAFQIHISGNDFSMGTNLDVRNLPNKVNSKSLGKNKIKIEDAKSVRTSSSQPSHYQHDNNFSLQVQRYWAPPLDVDSSVQISYEIDENGNVVNAVITSSTGNKEAEEAAMKALTKAKSMFATEYMKGLTYSFFVEPYRW